MAINYFCGIMDDVSEILQRILSSEMLAQSPGILAKTLGYRSTSTLYRLKSGEASANAVATFLQKLNDCLYIDQEILKKIDTTLRNYEYLSGTVKATGMDLEPEDFICVLLTGDYDRLSAKYVATELPPLLKIRDEDPEALSCALFYYYVRRRFATFFVPRLTFRQQCQRVLAPLANRLYELFPENDAGRVLGDAYTTDSAVCQEMPILWNCITTGAAMLQCYMRPRDYETTTSIFCLIPGIGQRSYWLAEDSSSILLLDAVMSNRHGYGYYEAYIADIDAGKVKSVCSLSFDGEGYVVINWKPSDLAQVGVCRFSGSSLTIDYGPAPREVACLTGQWTLLDIDSNAPLREFNDNLSDEQLLGSLYLAEGVEEIAGYVPVDVVISRKTLEIVLTNGHRLRIDRNSYSFLSNVNPDDTVIILRRLEDGVEFIHWREINMSIPLIYFDDITPQCHN